MCPEGFSFLNVGVGGVLSRACSEPRIAFASASDCNRGKDFVKLMMLRDAFWVTGAVLCSDLRM